MEFISDIIELFFLAALEKYYLEEDYKLQRFREIPRI